MTADAEQSPHAEGFCEGPAGCEGYNDFQPSREELWGLGWGCGDVPVLLSGLDLVCDGGQGVCHQQCLIKVEHNCHAAGVQHAGH